MVAGFQVSISGRIWVSTEERSADLERQLALRQQNSKTTSKPPVSDGLVGVLSADGDVEDPTARSLDTVRDERQVARIRSPSIPRAPGGGRDTASIPPVRSRGWQ